MRYTDPGYSRNDFNVISRYQCPVNDKIIPLKRSLLITPIEPQSHRTNNSNLVGMIRETNNIEEFEPLLYRNEIDRLAAEEAATAKVVKPCPQCNKPTYLIDGCNYMKCSESDPVSSCPAQWCFYCSKIKYTPIPGKEYLGCCNDLNHNSH